MSPTRNVKEDAKQADRLVSTAIAATRLGRTPRQLRRMIFRGQIAAVRDSNRLYLYESTITAYLGKLPSAKGTAQ